MCSISVIVPVYNAEKTLPKCLNSIANQTFTDFEVILVNDGSSDSSAEICKKYAESDPRFKLISQKNAGPSAARNTGIENSTGKYLAFVDSDDYVEPEMLQEFYVAAEKYNADLTICGYKKVRKSGNIVKISKLKYEPGLYVGDACRKIAIESISYSCPETIKPISWMRFVRRDLLIKHNLRYDLKVRFGEDFLLWTKLFFKVDRLCLINDKHLYNYVDNKSSITHNHVPGLWASVQYSYDDLKASLPDEPEIGTALDDFYFHLSLSAMPIAAWASSRKEANHDFNAVFKDKRLRKIIKNTPLVFGERTCSYKLMMKLHLYWLIKIAYLFKYRKHNKK